MEIVHRCPRVSPAQLILAILGSKVPRDMLDDGPSRKLVRLSLVETKSGMSMSELFVCVIEVDVIGRAAEIAPTR